MRACVLSLRARVRVRVSCTCVSYCARLAADIDANSA